MAAIRSRDTKPEMLIRSGLHRQGFRFRLHDRSIPGTPDIVLKRYRALIDIRSCFFHGHDCDLFRWPKTRTEFWRSKIDGNRLRDTHTHSLQSELGWRVAIIWECSLKGRNRIGIDAIVERLSLWFISNERGIEITGDGAVPDGSYDADHQ